MYQVIVCVLCCISFARSTITVVFLFAFQIKHTPIIFKETAFMEFLIVGVWYIGLFNDGEEAQLVAYTLIQHGINTGIFVSLLLLQCLGSCECIGRHLAISLYNF